MRLCIFIDASNIWEAQKAKGRFFDFTKLIAHLKTAHTASNVKVFYYTAYPAKTARSYDLGKKHGFFTYLKKGLGFEVRKKELKTITIADNNGRSTQIEKGNMDVETAIDFIESMPTWDIGILFSGDSDFLPLIVNAKQKGKKVFVYSSQNNISIELRTGGDGYFDVLKIREDIWGKEIIRRQNLFDAAA
jgi:uncharacterized LabA/DUF88 family protein